MSAPAANAFSLPMMTMQPMPSFASNAQPQQLGQLLKRGSELTGPREPMLIELRQVLYVENMRDDSQVVQAIKRFKSGEQPAPATQAPTVAPPTGTARPSASR